MKSINELSNFFDRFGNKIINNLKEAQNQTAEDILNELHQNANIDTGEWRSAIYRTPTQVIGDSIETSILSNTLVTSKSGKSYNLAKLLEYGTSPHAIPNAFGWGEEFGTEPDFHPGMIAYNNFHNAMVNNELAYKDRISQAVKESFK